VLRDESGNDYYAVSDGQGVSITNSVALFLDEQGDDFYATPNGGQGRSGYRRGFSGTGVFLDLEGADQYTGDVLGEDGAVWSAQDFAVGLDLDRDVEIPGEVVPGIVLTAADSARAVDELFETASLWEVGSARETVRRARRALIAKGMEAVAYATGVSYPGANASGVLYPDGEPLAAQNTLVYRTILELAQAYPDSVTARVLPRLRDPNPQVQRNVITLLGELKRKDARAPLEEMLRDRTEEEHWTRILGALGDIGEPTSRAAVRPFLDDREERRRIGALAALRSLSDTTAVPSMIPLFDDPLFTVRSAAMATTGSLHAASSDLLIARLAEVPKGSPAQVAIVLTLGNILQALRETEDPVELEARARVRATLMRFLETGMGRSGSGIEAAGRGSAAARAAAVQALWRMGEPETQDWIRLRLLDEHDPLVARLLAWLTEHEDARRGD
jgi:HEAT repeat protein